MPTRRKASAALPPFAFVRANLENRRRRTLLDVAPRESIMSRQSTWNRTIHLAGCLVGGVAVWVSAIAGAEPAKPGAAQPSKTRTIEAGSLKVVVPDAWQTKA